MTSLDPDGGLQAERTALAWNRTCFAVIANGVILMVVPSGERLSAGYTLSGCLALVSAGLVCLVGARRRRTFNGWPLPTLLRAPRSVFFVGWAVAASAAMSAVMLAF
ncbi:MAG: DUF202 domain-containing protein [Mycobacterium sp.]